jgi:hypothetical protein
MLCSNCNRHVKPVVGVDIDGLLGNYHEHFTWFAEMYLGRPLPRPYEGGEEFSDFLQLDKRVYREIKLAYRQGGLKRFLPMYDGADLFVKTLQALGVEIWIATTRPYLRLDNIDPDTRHWLKWNDIPYDFMVHGEDKWIQLINQVGKDRIICVFDDLLEECQKAWDLGLMINQPDRVHNSREPWHYRFEIWSHPLAWIADIVNRWEVRDGHQRKTVEDGGVPGGASRMVRDEPRDVSG